MKLGNDPPARLALTALERMVLEAVARSVGNHAPALLVQVTRANVVNRSHSGVGFVTRLSVPADAAPVLVRQIEVVRARHPNLGQPAEFLIQLRDGRLATIEAYCHEGMWPEDETKFSIEPAQRS